MNLLTELAQMGKVTQKNFLFSANWPRNLVISGTATACLFSGVLLIHCSKSLGVVFLAFSLEL